MDNPAALCARACLVVAVAAVCAGSALPKSIAAATPDSDDSDVIVILRDQLATVPPARLAMGARAAAVANSQSPLLSDLQQRRARKVVSFATINAFATRVSAAEAAQLAAHPLVQSVVPDRIIRAPRHAHAAQPASVGVVAAAATPAATPAELCGTLEPEALQLTHTAFANSSTAQAQTVLDGNGQPITGKGVKVAYIADGLDPNVAGFIRPDGSHVFIDYQNFNGDPAGTATGGAEAFGDASSIAAQDFPKGKLLTFDISKFVNAAHPLPSPCDIHVRGMAPGASLVGLNTFSQLGGSPTSNFVQAIEYAVSHDDVDVINESFGSNPYPDNSNDPISLANEAAIKAGVTVTVSSGDAGSMGTVEGSAPDVILVGATTQLRLYAQTGYYVQSLAHGYVDDNIAAFSSGGIPASSPRTVDVVAPGDSGWALCSKNQAIYTECSDYTSAEGPTSIQDFGGTSEAAPLTAGEAALIIQAYRSTHAGASPSPALVKRIIVSTATDLGAPTGEQGAGLINSLAAVRLALSVDDHNGDPKSHGPALLSDTTRLEVIDNPNSHERREFTLTNRGSAAREISPSLQTLGPVIAGRTFNLTLNPANEPTFLSVTGASRSYIEQKFTVPAGLQHLDAAVSFQVPISNLGSADSPYVYLALLDPSGRQVQYSEPQQGPPSSPASGYAHVDAIAPAAGVWTAVLFTRTTGSGVYSGPVQFTWSGENFVEFGSIHPSKASLAPGASVTFTADFFTPFQSGDLAAGIRFTEGDGGHTLPSIPLVMRTLVPTGPTGGTFSGTLTGGNGRGGAGNAQTFEFMVPQGVRNMSLVLPVADNGYLLEGLLVDPQGMQLSVGVNLDPFGAPQYALQHFHDNPQPGPWKFILVQTYISSGNQTSLPFNARIGFNQAEITASGLPVRARLSASGGPVTATIAVMNTGALTEAYFADARGSTPTILALGQQPGCAPVATLPGACAEFILPTQVSHVQFTAQSTVPVQMDAYNLVGYAVGTGNPDLFAQKTSKDTVVASLSEPEIPYGAWYVDPSEIGPYKAAGASTQPALLTASVVTLPFDAAVSADSGDAWEDLTLGTATFNPLLLAAGEAGTITLTITPDPNAVGSTVNGFVFIDTYNPYIGTGDEVVRIPYSYTVVP